MTQRDFRARMSPAEFEAIICEDEHPLDNYYAELVDGNEKFRDIYGEFPRGYEDIKLIHQLTPGQQILILLGVLDGQICNGGITQFPQSKQKSLPKVDILSLIEGVRIC